MPNAPIRTFIQLHKSDPDLAGNIVQYVWNELVDSKEWSICERYLEDPMGRYETALERFDVSMRICEADEALGGVDFERQIEGWYVRDVSNLLLVLRNVSRSDDYSRIRERAEKDMRSRHRSPLIETIDEKAAL